MPSQHKYPPLRFRPPEDDRIWLIDLAEKTGRAVNAILADALREYRHGVDAAAHERRSRDPEP